MQHFIFIEPIIIANLRTNELDTNDKLYLSIIAEQNGLDILNYRHYRICKCIFRKSVNQN